MKSKVVTIFLVAFTFTALTNISSAEITDVYIDPAVPTTLDDITIFVSGVEANGPVNIYDTNF